MESRNATGFRPEAAEILNSAGLITGSLRQKTPFSARILPCSRSCASRRELCHAGFRENRVIDTDRSKPILNCTYCHDQAVNITTALRAARPPGYEWRSAVSYDVLMSCHVMSCHVMARCCHAVMALRWNPQRAGTNHFFRML